MLMGKPPETPKQEAPAPKREIKPNEVPAGMTPFEAAGLTKEQPRMSDAPPISMTSPDHVSMSDRAAAENAAREAEAAALNAAIEKRDNAA